MYSRSHQSTWPSIAYLRSTYLAVDTLDSLKQVVFLSWSRLRSVPALPARPPPQAPSPQLLGPLWFPPFHSTARFRELCQIQPSGPSQSQKKHCGAVASCLRLAYQGEQASQVGSLDKPARSGSTGQGLRVCTIRALKQPNTPTRDPRCPKPNNPV